MVQDRQGARATRNTMTTGQGFNEGFHRCVVRCYSGGEDVTRGVRGLMRAIARALSRGADQFGSKSVRYARDI